MTDEIARCQVCGEPMPEGETMFKFHGYSGPCPAPPKPRPTLKGEIIKILTEGDMKFWPTEQKADELVALFKRININAC